jgi:hypothetical protein
MTNVPPGDAKENDVDDSKDSDEDERSEDM